MAVTRERFTQGLTYEAFKAQMTRNQERFAANEAGVHLRPEDVAALKGLTQPVHVLVLAEDWCGDVIDNLPVLGQLAAATGTLDVRVFLRDQNLDIMDQYLNQGQFRSIPVFVFFNQDFTELGHFIERPASVTARRDEQRRTVFAQHPEFGDPETPISQLSEETRTQLMAALLPIREGNKAEDNAAVVEAIRAIALPA
jgi:hypothetical protein